MITALFPRTVSSCVHFLFPRISLKTVSRTVPSVMYDPADFVFPGRQIPLHRPYAQVPFLKTATAVPSGRIPSMDKSRAPIMKST